MALLLRLSIDFGIVGITLSLCFIFAWFYFTNILFRNYELGPSKCPIILFCTTFTVSCSMFELIIFEILDILDKQFRWYNWKVDLVVILTLLIFVFPWYQANIAISSYNINRFHAFLLSSIVELVFLYAFWKFGVPFPLLKEESYIFSVSIGISRIGILGVALMAILSGFGAVSFPATNLTIFMKDIKPRQIHHMEKQLLQTMNKISSKKKKLLLMGIDNTHKFIGSYSSKTPFFLDRLVRKKFATGMYKFFVRRRLIVANENPLDLSYLKNEIKALEEFSFEQFIELNELNLEMERIAFSRTWKGKIYNLAAYFFSGYCVYKIFISSINILFDRKATNDPITTGLAMASNWLGVQIEVSFWSQNITLIMIGAMIALTIRGFLDKLLRIFSEYSNTVISTNTSLLLTQFMGMYFVSTILLIRINLPENYRAIISSVLGDIRFDFYHRWFDFIFIPSALFTIFLFVVGRKTSVIGLA